MPIRYKEGQNVTFCINADAEGHGGGPHTTMFKGEGWSALMVMSPPPNVVFNAASGTPVRCYVCRVCGYVEMYLGTISEPAAWVAGFQAGSSRG